MTVRPVFDDALYEYEVIAGARDWVAVRHLRESRCRGSTCWCAVAMVDDDGARASWRTPTGTRSTLPDPLMAAFGGEAVARRRGRRSDRRGSTGRWRRVSSRPPSQIARAQDARRGDGLPPYPVGRSDAADRRGRCSDERRRAVAGVAAASSTRAADAVTFRLDAADDLPPEMLARVVKAMIDGAAADGIAVTWATDPSAATSP